MRERKVARRQSSVLRDRDSSGTGNGFAFQIKRLLKAGSDQIRRDDRARLPRREVARFGVQGEIIGIDGLSRRFQPCIAFQRNDTCRLVHARPVRERTVAIVADHDVAFGDV